MSSILFSILHFPFFIAQKKAPITDLIQLSGLKNGGYLLYLRLLTEVPSPCTVRNYLWSKKYEQALAHIFLFSFFISPLSGTKKKPRSLI